jgi:hypothetical protein
VKNDIKHSLFHTIDNSLITSLGNDISLEIQIKTERKENSEYNTIVTKIIETQKYKYRTTISQTSEVLRDGEPEIKIKIKTSDSSQTNITKISLRGKNVKFQSQKRKRYLTLRNS